jgi:hypothetical protein
MRRFWVLLGRPVPRALIAPAGIGSYPRSLGSLLCRHPLRSHSATLLAALAATRDGLKVLPVIARSRVRGLSDDAGCKAVQVHDRILLRALRALAARSYATVCAVVSAMCASASGVGQAGTSAPACGSISAMCWT